MTEVKQVKAAVRKPKKVGKLTNPQAWVPGLGRLCTPREATQWKWRIFTCPDCKKHLFLREYQRGDREPHFFHEGHAPCVKPRAASEKVTPIAQKVVKNTIPQRREGSSVPSTVTTTGGRAGSGGEGDMHRAAKLWLLKHLKAGGHIRAYQNCSRCLREQECGDLISDGSWSITSEATLPDGGRADLAIEKEGKILFAVEILHTHRSAIRPVPWYEFRAKDILAFEWEEKELPIQTVSVNLEDVKAIETFLCRSCQTGEGKSVIPTRSEASAVENKRVPEKAVETKERRLALAPRTRTGAVEQKELKRPEEKRRKLVLTSRIRTGTIGQKVSKRPKSSVVGDALADVYTKCPQCNDAMEIAHLALYRRCGTCNNRGRPCPDCGVKTSKDQLETYRRCFPCNKQRKWKVAQRA